MVRPRSVTARRTPARTRFKWRLRCAFSSRIPTVSIRDYKCSTMWSHARVGWIAMARRPTRWSGSLGRAPSQPASAAPRCVRTVSDTQRNPGQHGNLWGHSDAYRCCRKSLMESALVRVGVSQCGPPESISKRAPSTTRTSLRLESTVCGQPKTPSAGIASDLSI